MACLNWHKAKQSACAQHKGRAAQWPWKSVHGIIASSLIQLSGSLSPVLGAGCAADVVDIRNSGASLRFQVEVADDPQERSKGLMFRATLGRYAGMLFVYDRPQRAGFWMKNKLIPLDMLFIDSTGTVTRIHENAIPHDTTMIDGGLCRLSYSWKFCQRSHY